MQKKNWSVEASKASEIGENYQHIYYEICDLRDGLLKFNDEPEYEQLLKNKRVAVVGPAQTLLGKKRGELIDSYDIVVRFNDAIEHLPVSASLADAIGTRADILYCNQVILRKNILKQKGISHERFIKICEEAKIKYFVCTNNSLSFNKTGEPNPSCEKQDKQVISDFQRFLSRHRIQARLRVVYEASEMIMRWMNGNFGRTGFVAIFDLLQLDISQLYVTGMTFYHGGGHLYSTDSPELHPLKNRDGTWARDHSGFGHNSYLELQLMKLMVKCFHKKLKLDEELFSLLNHTRS